MIRHGFPPVALAALACLFAPLALHSQEPPRPDHLPKLEYQRWSGQVNVPDPVAISVADNGEVFVTQTQRRKIQDLDIRQHTEWIPDDVGFKRVEDKRRFYHETFPIGGDQDAAAKHLQDLNEDGTIDWRDLTVISEKIHRLVDRDGDGKADQSNVYAEGFQTEVTGIAAGVMHWKNDVYATIAPDVWKLTDSNGDGTADQREVLATGFGLHIAYAGHDMHGLTIGPDGKIYWSIGDKGISTVDQEGKRHSFPNQGGVMRCNPDGSDLEVFAHGLRNVQEFAFDQHGNLFGVDNDADKPGERERFVWIVDQMDAGWRCNYQYRGSDYDPWVAEKLWERPQDQRGRYDQPAYVIPPIKHYVDGPAGFKFNPGSALSSAYKNFFFVTSAPNGYQYAFRCEPDGDSFRMVDSHLIGSGDPIVGLDFGPDGGLFGVDWGGGYPLNQRGSVIRIDVTEDQLTQAERQTRQEVQRWLREGFADRSDEQLVMMLSHEDQRIRLRAQFQLAERRQVARFTEVLGDFDANPLARVHCVWGLGQLIRAGELASTSLRPFLRDRDPTIRKVVCKTLGETKDADGRWLIPLLWDSDLHVRVHAALALGRRPTEEAIEPLVKAARNLRPEQHYLQHAICTALASCASPDALIDAASTGQHVGLIHCVIVALRRQGNPGVAGFLASGKAEAARAIHDDQGIPEELQELADFLNAVPVLPDAMTVRMINANFRLGQLEHSRQVARYIEDSRKPKAMRLNAIDAIGQWLDPPPLDRVDGRRRVLSVDREIDRQAISSLLLDLVGGRDTNLRLAAVRAARKLNIELSRPALAALLQDAQTPEELRLEALRSLTNTQDGRLNSIGLLIEQSGGSSDRVAAASIEVLAEIDSQLAMTRIPNLLESAPTRVRQACIKALAKNLGRDENNLLLKLGQRLAAGELDPSLKLDVWQALSTLAKESQPAASLLETIASLPELSAVPEARLKPFVWSRDGGDARRGEQIFRTDLRAQCIRCHRVDKQGSDIGPALSQIAKTRDADHLLRAVVYPSADMEAKYNSKSVLLVDGKVVQGVVKSEDDDTMVLIGSDGKEVEIPVDDIEAVAESKQSLMPDVTAVLSPAEVRDIVAYLRTLR